MRGTTAAWVVLLACLAGWSVSQARSVPAALPAGADLTVRVSTTARALQPGEAVLVTVRTSMPVDSVSGSAFKGPLRFARTNPGGHLGRASTRCGAGLQPCVRAGLKACPTPTQVSDGTRDPLEWEALAGIDVGAPAGPRELAVRAEAAGRIAEATLTVTVLPKRFPDRRIQVPPEFLTPPAAEMPRIERETKRLAEVLAGVSPNRLWQGPFVAPVPGGETSAFGRVSVVNGVRRSPHGGVDLAAAEGTPVKAPGAGVVVLSDALYFGGETIILDHGLGVFSLVAHLSARQRSAGETVAQGEIVGLSGATGRVTGPHLHWAVRIAGAVVDPLSLLHVTDETRRAR